MKHLARAGAVLTAVLILVFVVPKAISVPASLADYGFHPKETARNTEAWASLPIEYAQSAICLSCHQDQYGLWQKGNHKTIACENCHGPARAHLEGKALPAVNTSRELCGLCHAKLISRPSNFPQVDMNEMGGQAECTTCHNPHEPRVGIPPQVLHTLEGRSQCQLCHGAHEPWTAPPAQIPHTLEGRTGCLSCHGPAELRGATLPSPPHTMEGRSDCLACHNASGIKPFPADHLGRTSATCLNCHRSE